MTKNWFQRKHNGKVEVLVEWDDQSEGRAHYVAVECLQSTSSAMQLAGGSTVVWNSQWRGIIVPRDDPSPESDTDSDSDLPLATIKAARLSQQAPDISDDDSFTDPTYVEKRRSTWSDSTSSDSDSDSHPSRPNTSDLAPTLGHNLDDDTNAEPVEEQSPGENQPPADQTEKRARTKADQISQAAEKHPLIEAECPKGCAKKCAAQIPPDERAKINSEFWKMEYDQQRIWIRQTVRCRAKKRSRTKAATSRRQHTNEYMLKSQAGDTVPVCKEFFLTTLGFKKGNDKMVRNALQSCDAQSTPKADQRGRHEPGNKLDHQLIRDHIESFNPSIPHYRREHAPNRRYLPSDITITLMHQDFNQQNQKIGFDLYRRVLKEMNIGFVALCGEECERCTLHTVHLEETGQHEQNECDECNDHEKHMQRAGEARRAYQDDGLVNIDDRVIVAADLQKVIMLPRLPGIKSCLFTPRIIAFNETFAVIGNKTQSGRVRASEAVVWHEATTGRNADDIASAFWRFLVANGSAKSFVIWLDNCAAQNKNWTLFTMLIIALNCGFLEAETMKLKYLEAGHTFMAADSIHHGVELSMKHMKKVEDFSDFHKAVTNARKETVKAMELGYEDVRAWCDGFSRHKLARMEPRPYLKDMVTVKFIKESSKFYYKTEFTATGYTKVDAIRKGFDVAQLPPKKSKPNGISSDRKKKIMANLVGFLRPTARLFWTELPVSED